MIYATYWGRVAEDEVGAAEGEELGAPALPGLVVVEDALVDPAHVLDALGRRQCAVEQLHLQVGQPHDVVRHVLEPLRQDGRVAALHHAGRRAVQPPHLERVRPQLVRAENVPKSNCIISLTHLITI
jgi:hypothetical protein